MKSIRSSFYLAPILLVFAVWCGWFIHQSSFEVRGERYYSLFDDAMISMTYAKNVTQGHGLNWAKFGDPVEGYTSPLWTACMVPFQLLPIDWGKVSLAFAMFCALVSGLCVVVLDRILGRMGVTAVLPRVAAAFAMAFFYPLNYWSLVGMECGIQVLVFLLGLDQFLAFEQDPSRKTMRRLGMVLAAAMLLRMDMVFWVAIVIAFMAPWMWRHKRLALEFLAIAGLPMAAYLLFRILYFHDIFPNTYYLKLHQIPVEVRIARAWPLFVGWAKPLWLIWFSLPVMMVPLWRNKAAWMTFLLIPVYLAYNIYAGGDAWEFSDVGANRFTIITIPWALILLVAGAHGWASWIKGIGMQVLRQLLPAGMALLLLVLVNGLLFVGGVGKNWDRMLVKEMPFNTQFQMWNVMIAMDINDKFGSGNRVAVVQAGDIGYFANCELADVMGYNDRHIAHGPPVVDLRTMPPEWYHPGHVKVDFGYLLKTLKPDYLQNVWFRDTPLIEAETKKLLTELGYEKYPKGGYIKTDFQRRDK